MDARPGKNRIIFVTEEYQILCISSGLLNQVGDINLAIHDFAEFAPVVPLQKLKDVVVHVSRCSDGAEIFSFWAFYGETYDRRTL